MAERLRYVPQVERADCGAACLAMVLSHLGKPVPLDEVRLVTGSGRDGTDALALVEAARWFGLRARGVRASLDDLSALPFGSILFWDLSHFVVLERAPAGSRRSATIVDPSVGRRRVSSEELNRSFSGVALLVEPGPDFLPGARRRRRLVRHVAPVLRQRATLGRVVTVSLLLRLVGLGLPLLTAALVDRVVPAADRHLLLILVLGLSVMVAVNFGSSWVRSRLLLELRTAADESMTLGFLEHLMALPYTFHLNRSPGDLLMRLRSNSVVREIFTTGALSALLDGVFVSVYLVVLIILSPPLAALVVGLGAAQVLVLLLSRRPTQRLAAEGLQTEARTQSLAFQLLAGMGSIKAAGAEPRAVERFAGLFTEELAVSWQRGRLSALVDSVMGALRLASPLAVLAVGGVFVLDGRLSLGTALAFNALAAGFLEPLGVLVSTGLSVQLLASYLDRLNDVLDTPAEQEGTAVSVAPRLNGGIVAERLSFAYSPLAPLVISDADVTIESGQKVALVGRSGSGKTTLGHLLVGLYTPTAGRVLHDGLDLGGLDARTVRTQLGVVTQDPYLFGVSVRDNIAFNRPGATLEMVRDAARRACVADEIESMPLAYDTVLGDGGTSVSGGQRQRVALARALLGSPRILLLDEATSHLDAITEAAVFEQLGQLRCTTIVIAHRLSTIVDADVIVVLDGGRVVERGTHASLMAKRRGVYRALIRGQSATRH